MQRGEPSLLSGNRKTAFHGCGGHVSVWRYSAEQQVPQLEQIAADAFTTENRSIVKLQEQTREASSLIIGCDAHEVPERDNVSMFFSTSNAVTVRSHNMMRTYTAHLGARAVYRSYEVSLGNQVSAMYLVGTIWV